MFQGSIVAIVTPMHDDGAVDFDALKKLVKFHIDAGTDAIVSVGTTVSRQLSAWPSIQK